MKDILKFSLTIPWLLLAVLLACHSHDHDHEHNGDHEHGEGRESVVVTVWEDGYELFMEYPQLRVGESADFAAHLTGLSDFSPVSQGPVRFEFRRNDRSTGERILDSPTRDGLFVPEFTFENAGEYGMVVHVEVPGRSGSVTVPPLQVYDAGEEIPPVPEVSVQGDRISYLKEQQWKLPFSTAVVESGTVEETIRLSGQILPRAEKDFHVLPPLAGRFIAPPNGLPVVGASVREGQVLGYIEPPLARTERVALQSNQVQKEVTLAELREKISEAEVRIQETSARLELAREEMDRMERLHRLEAVPEKRRNQATKDVDIAESNLAAAERNLENLRRSLANLQNEGLEKKMADRRIAVQAPGSGTVVELHGSPGSFVEPSEILFRIIHLDRVWIQAHVPESRIHLTRQTGGGMLRLPGDQRMALSETRTQLVSAGEVVDPQRRTIPVIWETANSERRLKIGMLVEVAMKTGEAITGLVISSSALFREENKEVVYVQVSGETFDRRIVQTGIRNADQVQILEGLKEGERVVTEGGYEVALAARATDSAGAGHVH